MKKLTFILLLLASSAVDAQDWCAWSFRFTFKLDTVQPARNKFKDLEVFVNDSYTNEMLRSAELKLDSATKEYTVYLEYGCISCGWPRYDFPPDLYLKLNFDSSIMVKPFSTMIPVYFYQSGTYRDSTGSSHDAAINLGIIPTRHFTTDDHWKDKLESFEIIEVKTAFTIFYLKKGQYKPRRMNKLYKARQET